MFYGGGYDLSYRKSFNADRISSINSLIGGVGGSFYQKTYEDVKRSNIQVININSNLMASLNKGWYTQVRGEVSHIKLNNSSLADFIGFSGRLGYKLNKSIISYAFQSNHKTYIDFENAGKEGKENSHSIYYRSRLKFGGILGLSAKSSFNDLNESSYSYRSNKVSIILDIPFMENINLKVGSYYTENDYRGLEQYYTEKRKDEIIKNMASMTYFDVMPGFDAELSLEDYDRKSNNDIHQYKRKVTSLSLTYVF